MWKPDEAPAARPAKQKRGPVERFVGSAADLFRAVVQAVGGQRQESRGRKASRGKRRSPVPVWAVVDLGPEPVLLPRAFAWRVEAATKSEARSMLKRQLRIRRLPRGTKLERVKDPNRGGR